MPEFEELVYFVDWDLDQPEYRAPLPSATILEDGHVVPAATGSQSAAASAGAFPMSGVQESISYLPREAVLAVRVGPTTFRAFWNCYNPDTERSVDNWDDEDEELVGTFIGVRDEREERIRVARCYDIEISFGDELDPTGAYVTARTNTRGSGAPADKWVATYWATIVKVTPHPWHAGIRTGGDLALRDNVLFSRPSQFIQRFGGVSRIGDKLRHKVLYVERDAALPAYRDLERTEVADVGVPNMEQYGVDDMSPAASGRIDSVQTLAALGVLKQMKNLRKFVDITQIKALRPTKDHLQWMTERTSNFDETAEALVGLYKGKGGESMKAGRQEPVDLDAIDSLPAVEGDDVAPMTSVHRAIPEFSGIMATITQLYNLSKATRMEWVNASGDSTEVLRDMDMVTLAWLNTRIDQLHKFCYPTTDLDDNIGHLWLANTAMVLFSQLPITSLVTPASFGTDGAALTLMLGCVTNRNRASFKDAPDPVPWGTPIRSTRRYTFSTGALPRLTGEDFGDGQAATDKPNEVFPTYMPGDSVQRGELIDTAGGAGDLIMPPDFDPTMREHWLHYWVKGSASLFKLKSGRFVRRGGMYLCLNTDADGQATEPGFLGGWWEPMTLGISNGMKVTVLHFVQDVVPGESSISMGIAARSLAGDIASELAPRAVNGKTLVPPDYGLTGVPSATMIRTFLEAEGEQALKGSEPRDLFMLFLSTAYTSIDRTLDPSAWPLLVWAFLGTGAKDGKLTDKQKKAEDKHAQATDHLRQLIHSYYTYEPEDIRRPTGTSSFVANWAAFRLLVDCVHMGGWRFGGWGLNAQEQVDNNYGMTPVPSLAKAIMKLITHEETRKLYRATPPELEEFAEYALPMTEDGKPVIDSLFVRGGPDGRDLGKVTEYPGYRITGPVVSGTQELSGRRQALSVAFLNDVAARQRLGIFDYAERRIFANGEKGTFLPTQEDHMKTRFPFSSNLRGMADVRMFNEGAELLKRMRDLMRVAKVDELSERVGMFLELMEKAVNHTTREQDNDAAAQALDGITGIVRVLTAIREMSLDDAVEYVDTHLASHVPNMEKLDGYMKSALSQRDFGNGHATTLDEAYQLSITALIEAEFDFWYAEKIRGAPGWGSDEPTVGE